MRRKFGTRRRLTVRPERRLILLTFRAQADSRVRSELMSGAGSLSDTFTPDLSSSVRNQCSRRYQPRMPRARLQHTPVPGTFSFPGASPSALVIDNHWPAPRIHTCSGSPGRSPGAPNVGGQRRLESSPVPGRLKHIRLALTILVSAKEGSPLAPSFTPNQFAIKLDDEVGAIEDEEGIDPEDGFDRRLDLLIRVILPAQPARRFDDEPREGRSIFKRCFSQDVIHSLYSGAGRWRTIRSLAMMRNSARLTGLMFMKAMIPPSSCTILASAGRSIIRQKMHAESDLMLLPRGIFNHVALTDHSFSDYSCVPPPSTHQRADKLLLLPGTHVRQNC